ncbi:MAG: PIG-L family deacetylase [Chloroflexi bacterium]|nr:PIG-L family deacetylase [Chloroflexota bacterium]
MAEDKLEHVPEDWQRGLAIVAHPDDLEYGASSAIAKWTAAGKEVVYVLASRGEAGIGAWPPERTAAVREAEERESARLVGVETVEFLDYRDGMIEYGLPLRRDLARAIRRHRPEAIVTIHFGLAWAGGALNQADHRTVGLAACDAARDAGNRWIFPDLLAEGLEPWGGVRHVFVHAAPASTHACDVGEALERGIASLQAHRAYFENLGAEFDPETFLRQGATEVGARLGCEYAVAFQLLSV